MLWFGWLWDHLEVCNGSELFKRKLATKFSTQFLVWKITSEWSKFVIQMEYSKQLIKWFVVAWLNLTSRLKVAISLSNRAVIQFKPYEKDYHQRKQCLWCDQIDANFWSDGILFSLAQNDPQFQPITGSIWRLQL